MISSTKLLKAPIVISSFDDQPMNSNSVQKLHEVESYKNSAQYDNPRDTTKIDKSSVKPPCV
ncbi:hypothetical protein PAHAL_2G379700 [Panicum hallii]|uniref:Uncharacterized protein n=1 Tax=Panicum hallii TaxID=206008 RepID=A0A2T8KRV8_9POAL|nr:hypothetical protein PAHAL_2G379700 [Panicum hallii]